MKILHVTISDDRTRQQGIGRYVRDLSLEQAEAGEEPMVLYAGPTLCPGKPRILPSPGDDATVPHYRLMKALPEALRYGVSRPARYRKPYDENLFVRFLAERQPDILHVHTVQGIPAELFRAAAGLKIPMLYTTHDFYPICLRCNLVTAGGKLCRGPADPALCAACNAGAKDYALLQDLIQTDLYARLKNSAAAEKGRRLLTAKAQKSFSEEMESKAGPASRQAAAPARINEYASLIRYYYDILMLMNRIHFNSSITEKCYRERFPVRSWVTLPITRKLPEPSVRLTKDGPLRISYMGGLIPHKGLEVFLGAVRMLPAGRIRPVMYGPGTEKGRSRDGIPEGGEFRTPEETKEAWEQTDVLIVPSTWPETFGFLVPEALDRGIPAVCSDLVGAADCLGELREELTFPAGRADRLAAVLERLLDRDCLRRTEEKVPQARRLKTLKQHEREIKDVYRDLCGG